MAQSRASFAQREEWYVLGVRAQVRPLMGMIQTDYDFLCFAFIAGYAAFCFRDSSPCCFSFSYTISLGLQGYLSFPVLRLAVA